MPSGRLTGIAEFGIIPTGYERLLPPEVQLVVRARRRAVVTRARGRVLDLGGADSHRLLWPDQSVDEVTLLDAVDEAALRRLADAGERFDSIVSVFQLAAAPDLSSTIGLLHRLLTSEGELLFVEPGRQAGSLGRAQRFVAPSVAVLTRWRVDRDIPGSLRRQQLSVTSIERHRVPTIQWWFRTVIEGSAHRALPAATPDSP